MNRINPRKLANSKWTAVTPVDRQRHFVVVQVDVDDESQQVVGCEIEAVLTRRRQAIDWRDLRDEQRWRFGWR